MTSTKAFELTSTIIVMLVLSVVIFGGAIAFTAKFFQSTTEIQAHLDEQTSSEIESLLNRGERVAIPINKAAVKRGQTKTFGVGVMNAVGEKRAFFVTVEFDSATDESEKKYLDAVSPIGDASVDSSSIDRSRALAELASWTLYNPGPYVIENNEVEKIPVLIKAKSDLGGAQTRPGTIVFKVCVDDYAPEEESAVPRCDSRASLYSQTVYKVYVRVV